MNEKIDSFKNRLKRALEHREMRAVDLCNLTKISQSTMSQYLSGYAEPKKARLQLIAEKLNVNPTWLMGLDVPMEHSDNLYAKHITLDTIAFEITGRSLQYSPQILAAICQSLKEILSYSTDNVLDGNKSMDILSILEDSNVSYDEKAYCLKSILDLALYDIKNNHLDFFYTLDKSSESKKLDKLTYLLGYLNETGLDKVIDYTTDISNMNMYRKYSGTTSATLPQAAHERTDIETNEEMKQIDNDIMNDPDF